MPAIPRGVRNKNPGNIDYNPRNAWVGQIGLEPKSAGVPNPRFAEFDCPENGIRALGKLILAYRGKDGMPGVGKPGIDTVTEVITRWAPGNENNTAAYIAAVAKRMVVLPTAPLVLADFKTLLGITMGIINHENGGIPYTQAVIEEGVRRALA
ncbi:structural protein P5 [Pseudomonas eucalypticola]|uniref:Structural protein P5 n=1 Tax=Pseudomonas eucalypticola TaxID=2599595 RepID=A0A7D5D8T2_9PSED|nr:structural protein P5 [Pseudomonas eucalypticola]QKZ05813.1 structural protein P5 [Pseudomonas eucalypticola]